MNKETYERFGAALDELEKVAYDTSDLIQKVYIKSCVSQLSKIYDEVKEIVKE